MALNKAEQRFVEKMSKDGLELDFIALALWFCRVQRIEPSFETFRDLRKELDEFYLEIEEG